jgi:hypothetical protein
MRRVGAEREGTTIVTPSQPRPGDGDGETPPLVSGGSRSPPGSSVRRSDSLLYQPTDCKELLSQRRRQCGRPRVSQ